MNLWFSNLIWNKKFYFLSFVTIWSEMAKNDTCLVKWHFIIIVSYHYYNCNCHQLIFGNNFHIILRFPFNIFPTNMSPLPGCQIILVTNPTHSVHVTYLSAFIKVFTGWFSGDVLMSVHVCVSLREHIPTVPLISQLH